jgi:hypothetical protein
MRVPFARPVAAGLLLASLAAPAVSASSSTSITIDNNFDTGAETFAASGFCASGSSVTSNLVVVGGRGGLTFHLDKTLTCDDRSGTLTIHVDAATANGTAGRDQGGWSVVSGTGAWAGASGGGRLDGEYVPTGVIDHYTGSLKP